MFRAEWSTLEVALSSVLDRTSGLVWLARLGSVALTGTEPTKDGSTIQGQFRVTPFVWSSTILSASPRLRRLIHLKYGGVELRPDHNRSRSEWRKS